MKPITITGFFLLISFLGFSQGEWNNWYFGIHAGMTFNSGFPVALPANPIFQSALMGASVSDSAGNLLFYSDGQVIYNRNNNIMPNGSGLLGSNSGYQPVFSVPKPNDPFKYYIFTAGEGNLFSPIVGLNYSILIPAMPLPVILSPIQDSQVFLPCSPGFST